MKVNIFKEQGNIGAYFFHNIKEYRVKILNEPLLTTSKVAGRPTNSLLDNKMYKFDIKRDL